MWVRSDPVVTVPEVPQGHPCPVIGGGLGGDIAGFFIWRKHYWRYGK